MKIKGKGFQHCVKYEFQPRKVNMNFLLTIFFSARAFRLFLIYCCCCLLALRDLSRVLFCILCQCGCHWVCVWTSIFILKMVRWSIGATNTASLCGVWPTLVCISPIGVAAVFLFSAPMSTISHPYMHQTTAKLSAHTHTQTQMNKQMTTFERKYVEKNVAVEQIDVCDMPMTSFILRV